MARQGESVPLADIRLALGQQDDVLILRNDCGAWRHVGKDGRRRLIPYGLEPGSADLVGILAPSGRWLSFEVKAPGATTDPERAERQARWARKVRRFGGFAVQRVTSKEEALAALDRAREGLSE